MNAMWHRVKVINDFESRLLAEIVDACDVDQIIERKFVAAKFCDLTQIARGDRVSGFAAKFSFGLNLQAKRFAERLEECGASHTNINNVVILSGAKNLALEASAA